MGVGRRRVNGTAETAGRTTRPDGRGFVSRRLLSRLTTAGRCAIPSLAPVTGLRPAGPAPYLAGIPSAFRSSRALACTIFSFLGPMRSRCFSTAVSCSSFGSA